MAKRFRFRLEPLLRLRRQREDEHKRVVAARLRQIAALRQEQQVLEAELGRQTQFLRDSLGEQRPDLDALKWQRHWLLRLRRGMLDAEGQMGAQQSMLAQERVALAEAGKQTKVLDRLKERRREAYIVEANRREQLELDDLNVQRYAHALMVVDAEPA